MSSNGGTGKGGNHPAAVRWFAALSSTLSSKRLVAPMRSLWCLDWTEAAAHPVPANMQSGDHTDQTGGVGTVPSAWVACAAPTRWLTSRIDSRSLYRSSKPSCTCCASVGGWTTKEHKAQLQFRMWTMLGTAIACPVSRFYLRSRLC
jgi:hypothetical protein